MLGLCWASVEDGGPTLNQYWVYMCLVYWELDHKTSADGAYRNMVADKQSSRRTFDIKGDTIKIRWE